MRYTILNSYNKFLVALLLLLAVFSVKISAQNTSSKKTAIDNSSLNRADTLIMEMPDGTFEQRIIKKNPASKTSSNNESVKGRSGSDAEQQMTRKIERTTLSDAGRNDTVIRELPNGTFEQIIIHRGNTFDCDDNKVYESADIMPEFIGGQTALYEYLSKSIQYPEKEAKNKIEGKVLVSFTVDRDGNVRDAKALRSPAKGEALAKEAIRIVSGMPKWSPGKKDGLRVHVRYTLPIDFKLKK